MADAGPPTLPAPQAQQAPQVPQVLQPPSQLPVHLTEPVPAQPVQHMPQLNWLQFKPEFAGKQEENAEAHLLRTNNWMDTHAFPEGFKLQHFCLMLIQARLWYESLRPINVDWLGLQNCLRQQYSKIGNTREQLFHVWRSFHFDENRETLDSYVTHIRQVSTLFGYGKLQILEVFKITLPPKLNQVPFFHRRL